MAAVEDGQTRQEHNKQTRSSLLHLRLTCFFFLHTNSWRTKTISHKRYNRHTNGSALHRFSICVSFLSLGMVNGAGKLTAILYCNVQTFNLLWEWNKWMRYKQLHACEVLSTTALLNRDQWFRFVELAQFLPSFYVYVGRKEDYFLRTNVGAVWFRHANFQDFWNLLLRLTFVSKLVEPSIPNVLSPLPAIFCCAVVPNRKEEEKKAKCEEVSFLNSRKWKEVDRRKGVKLQNRNERKKNQQTTPAEIWTLNPQHTQLILYHWTHY